MYSSHQSLQVLRAADTFSYTLHGEEGRAAVVRNWNLWSAGRIVSGDSASAWLEVDAAMASLPGWAGRADGRAQCRQPARWECPCAVGAPPSDNIDNIVCRHSCSSESPFPGSLSKASFEAQKLWIW